MHTRPPISIRRPLVRSVGESLPPVEVPPTPRATIAPAPPVAAVSDRLEQLLEVSGAALWSGVLAPHSGVATWESLRPVSLEAARRLVALDAGDGESYARAWRAALHPEDRPRVLARWAALADGELERGEVEFRVSDQERGLHWIREELRLEPASEGGGRRVHVYSYEITRQRRDEETLHHALLATRCLIWHAEVDRDEAGWRWQTHLMPPDAALECFQVERAAGELYAASWQRAIVAEDAAAIRMQRDAAVEAGLTSFTCTYRIRDYRGIVRQIQEQVRLLPVGEGHWSAIGVCTDHTLQQKALSELRASREEYRALFEHVPIGIYRMDPSGQFVMANPALLLMLGFDANDDPARLEDCLAENDRPAFLKKLVSAGSLRGWESGWRRRDGARIFVRENVKAVRNPEGALLCFEGTVEDITERRRAAERMEWQATHDALTGLPNRSSFLEALQTALGEAKAQEGMVGVLFVDLDKFKQINDLQGHGVGDKLLPMIAERLKGVVREGDVVARMGGDEFTLLLPNLKDAFIARRIAAGLRATIAEPVLLDGRSYEMTVSVGAVLYPQDGEDAETLLRHADIAMYRAKGQGGDGVAFFAASMHEEMRERVTLEADLRRALTNNELVLHYQPQVSVTSHRVVGVEALVRWEHPERGLLPPSQFVPLAEETGLIIPLGEWVLKEACQQGAKWLAAGVPLKVSVNMSPKQLMQPNYAALVASILEETLFDSRLLEAELTESAILENGDRVEATMDALRALGVGLQMDDFGTGYSSLALLRRYRMDVLKVDKGFVQGVATDPEDAAIVRSVLELAHTLGMMVIAEGVETPAQLRRLEELDCDIVQGYLMGGPVPAENLMQAIAQIGGVAVPERRAA